MKITNLVPRLSMYDANDNGKLEPGPSDNENSFNHLLQRARIGDAEAMGLLLQNHRDYLLMVANQDIDPQIKGKVGSSDIVQESLLTAHQKFGQFRGDSKSEFLAWLRQIVKNDLLHARRAFTGTKKRQVDRERPIQYGSSLMYPLVDQEMTPATNAMAMEEKRLLQQAMLKLPEDYRLVLRLHSWQQQSLEVIGETMSRSPDAVRKLFTRAVVKLKEELGKLRRANNLRPDSINDGLDWEGD